jgi:hypothetical protein
LPPRSRITDDDLALAGLVLPQTAIPPVLAMVCRLDVTAKIAAVDLRALALAADRAQADFGRHRFPDLVREHESRLVLRPEIAGERQHAVALDLIREDRDRHQVRPQRHLMEGEQRPGGNVEILAAGFAAPPWRTVRSPTG